MSNIVELPDNQRCVNEAAEWLACLDKYDDQSVSLSNKDEKALQQWLASNPQNQQMLFELIELWDKMDTLSRLSDLFDKPSVTPQVNKQSAMFSASTISAIAASFFFAAFIGLFVVKGNDWFFTNSDKLLAQEPSYQTAVGEHSTVTLSDGSRLMLNTHTLVSVEYTDNYRLIRLLRGEVHVSVAKDKNRPLSVIAGNKIVQAVGTEFNIEITEDNAIELIVTEGKVKVGVHKSVNSRNNNADKSAASFKQGEVDTVAMQRLPDSSVTVSAGEELMLSSTKAPILAEGISEVEAADIAVKLSWRNGNLIFRGESLEEAVKEVGRYTSVEFVFMDEGLKQLRVAGLFKSGDVEGLLATLRENFNIVSHRVNGQKILLSKE